MKRSTRETCGFALVLALGAIGCGPAVGTMEIVDRDGTVTVLPIRRIDASQYARPADAPADAPWYSPPRVYVEAAGSDEVGVGILVTLQEHGAWAWSDVLTCTSGDGAPRCDRFPIDVEGDGRTDHVVRRTSTLEGEIVRAWAIFADDGEGPREVRVAFRFDPSAVAQLETTWTSAP